LKHGASREAIAETLAMAIYMGAGPSVMYAAEALEAVDQLAAKSSKPA
jgi:alkylhydroperoxidase/carboxymuconolactone decarboxylase family protein YurZ